MIVIAQEENIFAFQYVSSMYQHISIVLEILWKALWARQTFGNGPLTTVVLKNNVTSFLVTDRQVNTNLAIKYQGLGVL